MSTTTITEEPEVKPKLDDAPPDQWPPVSHLVRPEDEPVKPGTIAYCGAKLMGIDLGRKNSKSEVCPKCLEQWKKEHGWPS